MSELLAVFASVFIAELGDKTQVAILLFAASREQAPMLVFAAAALALVASTALAVFCGTFAERWLAVVPLELIAGLGFIAIGVWTVWRYFQSAALHG